VRAPPIDLSKGVQDLWRRSAQRHPAVNNAGDDALELIRTKRNGELGG
jgi:hypothetical protein